MIKGKGVGSKSQGVGQLGFSLAEFMVVAAMMSAPTALATQWIFEEG